MLISFKKLLGSFKNAVKGISIALGENTFRIMILITIPTVFFTLYLPLEALQRTVIFLLVGVVLAVELINSQIERVLDLLEPDYNLKVKRIKDISAGAVLIISVISFIIGVTIFLPILIQVVKG